jgi:hypothetical protein
VVNSAATARHIEEGIDVIVRFHDPRRQLELQRAVFSLVGQTYRPMRILLATQRFSAQETEATLSGLAPMLSWAGEIEVTPLNFPHRYPDDARSELINMGFAAATGRYVALLDYDDVLYPEAYQLLVGRLRTTGAGIAFARTPVVRADVHGSFLHARAQSHPFPGRTLGDLFRSNFCPIHSYVIDRARVLPGALRADPILPFDEDYDLLIRICALVRADFALVDTDIGLYFMKTDASNSYDRAGDLSPEFRARVLAAEAFLEARRGLVTLAPEVQRDLGVIEPIPGLTVRRWLDSVT